MNFTTKYINLSIVSFILCNIPLNRLLADGGNGQLIHLTDVGVSSGTLNVVGGREGKSHSREGDEDESSDTHFVRCGCIEMVGLEVEAGVCHRAMLTRGTLQNGVRQIEVSIPFVVGGLEVLDWKT